MSNINAKRLTDAMMYLNYARYQIKLALGDSDAGQESIKAIDELIEDLDADVVFLQEGAPRI